MFEDCCHATELKTCSEWTVYKAPIRLVYYSLVRYPCTILSYFRDKSECVLWFAETYGHVPKFLIMEEKQTGLSHEVWFSPGMAHYN